MAKRRANPDYVSKLISWGIPAACFIGGMVWNGFHLAEQVATKPYVDDRFSEAKKYTDITAAQTLKEAFEHSDANRAAMMLKMQEFDTNNKSAQAVIATKVDLVLKAVQDMRADAWNESQHARRK